MSEQHAAYTVEGEQQEICQCEATIEFGDDEGDNSCSFACELRAGHIGPHIESGELYGQQFAMTWT